MTSLLAGFNVGAPVAWAFDHLANEMSGNPVLHWIGPLGLAIVLVTVAYRIVLWPLFTKQLVQQQKMLSIQGKQAELRKRHKGDSVSLNKAIGEMYKEHDISPVQTCLLLPVLILPLIPLYSGVRMAASGVIPSERHFLWIANVGESAVKAFATNPGAGLIPVIATIVSMYQTYMMNMAGRGKNSGGMMQNQTTMMLVLMGVMTFLYTSGITGGFAQGIGIYSLTQSVFMIFQAGVILGWTSAPGVGWAWASLHPSTFESELARDTKVRQAMRKSADKASAARAKKGDSMDNSSTTIAAAVGSPGGSGSDKASTSARAQSRNKSKKKRR